MTRNKDGVLVNLSQFERVAKPAEKFPKYEKGDILTDGKNKYEVLSWDYTETGMAAYYMKGVGCKFSWSCEEADKKLHLVEQKPAYTEKGAKGNDREIPISEPPLTIKHAREVMGIKQDDALGQEDVKMIGTLIAIFEVNYPDGFYKVNPIGTTNMQGIHSSEIIKWLKSIKERYTWKPSDEQIKLLNEVLIFAASHESPHWNDYVFGTLNNLIRQLKKLREE